MTIGTGIAGGSFAIGFFTFLIKVVQYNFQKNMVEQDIDAAKNYNGRYVRSDICMERQKNIETQIGTLNTSFNEVKADIKSILKATKIGN